MAAELTRTLRFCLRADGSLDADTPAHNTFAAWPPMRGLGRYYELHLTCAGDVDPVTGYMLNIKQIDQAARAVALPLIAEAARRGGDDPVGPLLARLLHALDEKLPVTLRKLALQLTPTYAVTMEHDDMNHVLVSQRFDFSAAHRLHVPGMSEDENRRTFGKCNNPSGHGHNYRLEVAVHCPLDTSEGVEQLDAVVDRAVIQHFDHKHLNVDVPEFAGLNPSVEHIARVIYDRLKDAVKSLGVELDHVRVWETDKTVCTYRG